MFVASPELCQQVFAGEGKWVLILKQCGVRENFFPWKSQSVLIQRFPVHLVPEPWTIYLGKKGAARGLFFMDGEDW